MVYDTELMIWENISNWEIITKMYLGEKVNGYTYNQYFHCYDYDKTWYEDALIKDRNNKGYLYFTKDLELWWNNGLLYYRENKFHTKEFLGFYFLDGYEKKYRGKRESSKAYQLVCKGMSADVFLSSCKNMDKVKLKLLTQPV